MCGMGETRLNKELRGMARNLGLCDEWFGKWEDTTDSQGLIDKYFEGVDFPLKYHWPSNEYIKENFGRDILHKNNIIVDEKRSALNPDKAMVLGNSDATIRINGNSHSVIYARDCSSLKIYAKNAAFVIVHLFETAHAEIQAKDKSSVLALKHSVKATVKAQGAVRIKEELDYLE